jgi:LysR family transcriptional regulator, low CO2-responsive transcriptional regulator
MTNPRLRRYFRHGILTQLAAFEATARLGSCSKAGDALHLSQPTVSVLNKKLAESLGVALFEQVGKHLELTEAGRELLSASEQLHEVFEGLEEKLQSLRRVSAPGCSRCNTSWLNMGGAHREAA